MKDIDRYRLYVEGSYRYMEVTLNERSIGLYPKIDSNRKTNR